MKESKLEAELVNCIQDLSRPSVAAKPVENQCQPNHGSVLTAAETPLSSRVGNYYHQGSVKGNE